MSIGDAEQPPDVLIAPEARGDPGERDAKRRLRNGLISLVLLVVLVVALLLAVPGLNGVANAVTDMAPGLIVVAVGLEILSCLGYVLAFLQVFERAPIRFGARVALSELAFNAAVSIGGAGSAAIGAWLLVERGAPVKRVAERSVVLFLLTSAVNVITLVLAGLAVWTGLASGPSNLTLSLLPAAIGTVVFVGFLALPRLLRPRLIGRLPNRTRTVVETLATGITDTEEYLFSFDWRLLGAIGYLWFDIAVLMACLAAAGAHPPLAAVVLAYQIAYISNLIPIPGGIGILDGALVGVLVLYGVKAVPATAATVVYHAIALWVPALWGTIAFVFLRRTRRQPLVLRPPRRERAGRASGSASQRSPAR